MSKRHIRVVSAALERDGRYLITQRMAKAVLPLLWEFPGGRVEEGETDIQALTRELEHRLGIRVEVGDLISQTSREYHDYYVDLFLYRCSIGDHEPEPKKVQALEWVSSDDFERFDFTPADEKSMDALLFSETV